ncbi:site-specific integrase [Candidatus Bathyarchaeota archaeon]|nr:site-specific integrase [Candidatus Bathyarchaeota archaeon]
MAKPKYSRLLSDPKVRRWFDNVSRGSPVTAEVYLRRLGAFCESRGIDPQGLLSKKEDELYELFLDYVTEMQSGYAGSYIHSTIKALRSWLSFHGRELKRKVKIKGAQDTPTLKDERVPTKEELRRILLSGEKKARVASILMAHSGLRIESLGNYSGDDGLRLKDFPELLISDGKVDFLKVPTMVIVRKELSKARHQYFSFLSEEGCGYLKDYLEERMHTGKGERLSPESPIITPKLRMKPFIRTTNVGDLIRKAIRRAGFSWRPYVLRAYFDTQLMLAESKGLVLRDYRTFWMGHKGDIEARYTTNKGRLPEEVVEDMREAYRRSQAFLQTTAEASNEERLKEVMKRQLLLVVGFKEEEIDKMDLASMEEKEFQELVRRRLLGALANNGARQKIVSIGEIEAYLEEGWEFVAALPDGRAILRNPF